MKKLLLLSILFSSIGLFAQQGGNFTYKYLNLSPSARVTGLGGLAIATFDDDLNLAYQNPSLYNMDMDGQMSFSHSLYMAGIGHGYASYAKYAPGIDVTFGGGILYRTYGKFDRTDAAGIESGTFGASEFALSAGAGMQSDKLSYGINTKLLYSQLDDYNSLGIAFDLGASFVDTSSNFMVTMLLKNIGFQLMAYTPSNQEPLPFEIQIGLSKRLRYLPLRFSLLLHNLQKWDIRYSDPNAVDNSSIAFGQDSVEEKKYIFDKMFRHVNLSGEFYFGKAFRVRLGYNHLRRQELAVETARGLAGFSFGAGLVIKGFRFDYGYAVYNKAAGESHISLLTNIAKFRKKEKVIIDAPMDSN